MCNNLSAADLRTIKLIQAMIASEREQMKENIMADKFAAEQRKSG